MLLVLGPSDWDWDNTINSPGSQAFGRGLNYITGFSGPPAHVGQIVELLSLYNI